jgi:hypothetical protein
VIEITSDWRHQGLGRAEKRGEEKKDRSGRGLPRGEEKRERPEDGRRQRLTSGSGLQVWRCSGGPPATRSGATRVARLPGALGGVAPMVNRAGEAGRQPAATLHAGRERRRSGFARPAAGSVLQGQRRLPAA